MSAVVGAAAVSGAVVSLWWSLAGERRLSRRAAQNLRSGGLLPVTDLREHVLAEPASTRAVVPLLQRVAGHVKRLTPVGSIERLNRRIVMAGLASEWPLDRALAAKFVLAAFGALIGALLLLAGRPGSLVWGLVLTTGLFFAPDLLLRTKAQDRQKRLRVALPDTIDQITVCVEAGLGLEGAMARAARTGDGPLAEEIIRTLQDVQLGVPRREAMKGLSERNDVAELRQLVQAIVQAEGYGVPIGRVLRVQANELREKRRQTAEEKAMKISVKMLVPLVVCILPCLFIVILAPAIFSLVDSFSATG